MTGQLLAERTVADRLGVSTATVLRYVRRGRLPAVRLPDAAIRVGEKQLDESLTSRPMPGGRCHQPRSTPLPGHCPLRPYGDADE